MVGRAGLEPATHGSTSYLEGSNYITRLDIDRSLPTLVLLSLLFRVQTLASSVNAIKLLKKKPPFLSVGRSLYVLSTLLESYATPPNHYQTDCTMVATIGDSVDVMKYKLSYYSLYTKLFFRSSILFLIFVFCCSGCCT